MHKPESPEEAMKRMMWEMSPEGQQHRVAENRRKELLVKEYKKLVNAEGFALEFSWIEEKSRMPFDLLNSKFVNEFYSKLQQDFVVVKLDVDYVAERISDNSDKLFPTNSLWSKGNRDDFNIASVIEFLLQGKALIPPILKASEAYWSLYDGNHRFAVMRFFKVGCAPFLIDRNELHFVENNNCQNA